MWAGPFKLTWAQSYKGRGMDMAALQGLIFSTQSYKGHGMESTALYYARA